MRLSYNLPSLNIYREHSKVLTREGMSLERISSGYKVNGAKDNPNALASSEKIRIQIRGLQMAQRNAQDGVSMLQTSDGALDNVTAMLQRIRQLTIQAGGTTAPGDKATIQQEINQMIEGIDNVINNSEFNGVKLLNGSLSENIYMPVGANVGESVEIPVYDLRSYMLGNGTTNTLDDIDISSTNGINGALKIIDGALNQVVESRAKYGALCNRFESTYNKVGEVHDAITGAESKIRDADIAEEMMNYTRDNILVDAGHAMLAQSNKFPQEILRILENVRSR